MPYGIKSDLISAIFFIHDDIDSAIARAKLITNHTGRPTEVHTNEPHPLAAFGVAHSNPVTKISQKVAKAPTETLATLSGHNGGDVRTSSCDPEVYPFVLFERGNGGDCICAVHPELGELGRLGATRKEAVGRLRYGTNLRDANLWSANLEGADRKEAIGRLRDADLGGANLGGANLGGAIGRLKQL